MKNWLLHGSLVLSPLVLLCGCATVQVGEFNLNKDSWDWVQGELTRRASFELKCPKEQLKLTVLAAVNAATSSNNEPTQVGVEGCEHRLVFVQMRGKWVLNSSGTEAK